MMTRPAEFSTFRRAPRLRVVPSHQGEPVADGERVARRIEGREKPGPFATAYGPSLELKIHPGGGPVEFRQRGFGSVLVDRPTALDVARIILEEIEAEESHKGGGDEQ